MILTSSFSTVLVNQASGTARTNFGLAKIIKTFYDDHAIITGFFIILKAVDNYFTEALVPYGTIPYLGIVLKWIFLEVSQKLYH